MNGPQALGGANRPIGSPTMTRMAIGFVNGGNGTPSGVEWRFGNPLGGWKRGWVVGLTEGGGYVGAVSAGVLQQVNVLNTVTLGRAFLIGFTLSGGLLKAFINGNPAGSIAVPAYNGPVGIDPFELKTPIGATVRSEAYTFGLFGMEDVALSDADMLAYSNVVIDDLEQGRFLHTTTPAGVALDFYWDTRDMWTGILWSSRVGVWQAMDSFTQQPSVDAPHSPMRFDILP